MGLKRGGRWHADEIPRFCGLLCPIVLSRPKLAGDPKGGGSKSEKAGSHRADANTIFVERVCSPDISVTLAQEIGLNWTQLKGRDQWTERLAGRRAHSNFAHSVCELSDTDKLQAGGTAILVGAELQSRCQTHGHDPSGLGLWVWTRIQGSTIYNT
jgi:hypothetical protein